MGGKQTTEVQKSVEVDAKKSKILEVKKVAH